jgi:hypothetical protein
VFRSKRTPPPPPLIRGDVQILKNTKNDDEIRILYEGPYHVVYDVVPKGRGHLLLPAVEENCKSQEFLSKKTDDSGVFEEKSNVPNRKTELLKFKGAKRPKEDRSRSDWEKSTQILNDSYRRINSPR